MYRIYRVFGISKEVIEMKIRCNLCGEHILQRDEIIRCCIERVKKEKGDPSDPERFKAVQDWHCSFIAHSECCKEEIQSREAQVEIP